MATKTKKLLTARKVKGETWIEHKASGRCVPVFGELPTKKQAQPKLPKAPTESVTDACQVLAHERDQARRKLARAEKLRQTLRGAIADLKSQLYQKDKRIREQDTVLSEYPGLRARVATLEHSLEEANKRAKGYETRAIAAERDVGSTKR